MRLDPATLDRVDDWRTRQGDTPSRSEAIRRLLDKGLEASGLTTFLPSNPERLMTWLLTEILRTQKGYDQKDTIDLIQGVFYEGHFWALEEQMTGLLHSHVDSISARDLVVNTLDMWSFIESAYKSFSQEDRDRIEREVGPWATDPKFSGFDGHNETEYMGIARFLVEKMGRFISFKGRDFNSGYPTVNCYRRMVELFEPMRPSLVGRGLSVEQVIQLLKRE